MVHNQEATEPGSWRLEAMFDIPLDVIAPGAATIEDLAVSESGIVGVVTNSPVQVTLVAPDGRTILPTGRVGEGPGEYRQARVAFLGDTLLVIDPSTERVTRYSAIDGTLLDVRSRFCCPTYFPVSTDTLGRVAGNLAHRIPEERRIVATHYRRELLADHVDSLFTVVEPAGPSAVYLVTVAGEVAGRVPVPFTAGSHWAFGPGGELLLANGRAASILVTRTGRDTVRLVGWPVPEVAVTAAERDEAIEGLNRARSAVRARGRAPGIVRSGSRSGPQTDHRGAMG